MGVSYKVPFYSNTPDNTHCFQAVLRMTLKFFLPEREFSWEELDKITAKQKDLWTWSMAGFCWLAENGFEVIDIATLDYSRLAKEKEHYLAEKFGPDVAAAQVKHSNLEAEVGWVKKFTETVHYELRIPTVEDIRSYLDKGFLVIVNVNAAALVDKEGYLGHFLLITGHGNDGLIVHDPGLKARESLRLDMPTFQKSWDFPTKDSRNIAAVRLNT